MDENWEKLLSDVQACAGCGLAAGCTNKVPGQGDKAAPLMLIGEGPGEKEDMEGLAFVGPAGQLLTKMLLSVSLPRDRVYICNIVKCRPPHNRQPEKEEAEACMPFLRAQFTLVKPKIVVLLGATAARNILGEDLRITRDRGKWVEKKGVFFMPTYHPSALLRDESKKQDAWQDLQKVREKCRELHLYSDLFGEENAGE